MNILKFWMFVAILICGTSRVFAQKILTVDTEGNPVPYAHASTTFPPYPQRQ